MQLWRVGDPRARSVSRFTGVVLCPWARGAVWGIRLEVAGVSFYHQGSANLEDRELPHDPVDVFLAGIAGRSVTPHYWERVLSLLDPRSIVPTHYDNFFSPLGRPQDFVQRVNLAAVSDEVAGVSRDARLSALRRIDSPSLAAIQ